VGVALAGSLERVMRTPAERAAQWRKRAEEYRAIAESAGSPEMKTIYSDLARTYELLAALVKETEEIAAAAEKLRLKPGS
jgi:hypothetical protein